MSPMALVSFVALWTLMMAAMMVPSLIPSIRLFGSVSRSREPLGFPAVPAALFVAGYFTAWALLGLGVGLLVRLGPLGPVAQRVAIAAGLIAGGGYQMTILKSYCLNHFRSPLHF